MSDATKYGALAFGLCALLDEGAVLDPGETVARLQDGTLFGWLGDTFRHGISLGLFATDDLVAMLARFRSVHGAISGQRVYGIERNGLALMLAWCLSALHELQSEARPAPATPFRLASVIAAKGSSHRDRQLLGPGQIGSVAADDRHDEGVSLRRRRGRAADCGSSA